MYRNQNNITHSFGFHFGYFKGKSSLLELSISDMFNCLWRQNSGSSGLVLDLPFRSHSGDSKLVLPIHVFIWIMRGCLAYVWRLPTRRRQLTESHSSLPPLFIVKLCKCGFKLCLAGALSSDQSEEKICGRNLHKSAWLMYCVNWRSDTVTSPFLSDNIIQQLTLNWKRNCLLHPFICVAVGLSGKQTAFVCVIAHEQREMAGERGRGESVYVRGKLVNKQRRWMSLLKQWLIQAIRKQSEGVWEKRIHMFG